MRLTKLGKFTVSLGVAAILGAAICAVPSEKETVEYRYTVKEGDTLWSIAAQFCTEKDDIRDIVYGIREASGIKKNTYIQPGQELIVRVNVEQEWSQENERTQPHFDYIVAFRNKIVNENLFGLTK